MPRGRGRGLSLRSLGCSFHFLRLRGILQVDWAHVAAARAICRNSPNGLFIWVKTEPVEVCRQSLLQAHAMERPVADGELAVFRHEDGTNALDERRRHRNERTRRSRFSGGATGSRQTALAPTPLRPSGKAGEQHGRFLVRVPVHRVFDDVAVHLAAVARAAVIVPAAANRPVDMQVVFAARSSCWSSPPFQLV